MFLKLLMTKYWLLTIVNNRIVRHTNNTEPIINVECTDPASGFTMDYFKDVAGVKYTATPELRGNSFIVSKDNIPLSFNEVWNGVLALFNALPQSEL